MQESQIRSSPDRSKKDETKSGRLESKADTKWSKEASAHLQLQSEHAIDRPKLQTESGKRDVISSAHSKQAAASAKDILGDFEITGSSKQRTAPQVSLSVKAELLNGQAKNSRSDKVSAADSKTASDKKTNTQESQSENNTCKNGNISQRVAQIDVATEKILHGANERFGKNRIDDLKIAKGDVGAATSAILLGPDICKMMGPENTSLLGKQILVFGVAPIFGMADEAKKQISTNPGGMLHEGSGNFIVGTAIGAVLEKAHPLLLWSAVIGGGTWFANDQLNSPEHKVRNQELKEMNSKLANCSNAELLQFADRTKAVLGPEYYKGAFTLATGGAGLPEGQVLAAGAKEEAKGMLKQIKIGNLAQNLTQELKTLGKECWESLGILLNGGNKECFALSTGGGMGRDGILNTLAHNEGKLESNILKMTGKGGGSSLEETIEGTLKAAGNELANLEKKTVSNSCESLAQVNESLLKLQKHEIPGRAQAGQLAKLEDDFLKHVDDLQKDTAALKPKAEAIEAKAQKTEAEEKLLEKYYAQEDAIYQIVTDRLKTKYGWDGRTAGMKDLDISVKSGFGTQREVCNTISKTLNEGLDKNSVVQKILKQKGIDPERAKGWIGIVSDVGSAADHAGCDYLLVNKNTGEMYAIDVTERASNLGHGKMFDSKLTRPDIIFDGKSVPRERINTVIGVADDLTAENIAYRMRTGLKPSEAEQKLAALKEQQIAEIIAETISQPSRLNILHGELPSCSSSAPKSRAQYEMWRFRTALEKIGYTDWARAVNKSMNYLYDSWNRNLPDT